MGLAGAALGGSVVMTWIGLSEIPVFTVIALRMSLASLAFAVGLAALRPPLPTRRRTWARSAHGAGPRWPLPG